MDAIAQYDEPAVWRQDNCKILLTDGDWQLWTTEDGDNLWWWHEAARAVYAVEALTAPDSGRWAGEIQAAYLTDLAPRYDEMASADLPGVVDAERIAEAYEAGRIRAAGAIHGLPGSAKAGALIC